MTKNVEKSNHHCGGQSERRNRQDTTTENLGVGLALEGKKVLLVDTDPQASLTVSLGNP